MQIRRITLAALLSAAAACTAGNTGNQDSQFMDSRRGRPWSAGGLVISSPLVLDNAIVAAGGTLNGTVTYQNTSASPIAVQTSRNRRAAARRHQCGRAIYQSGALSPRADDPAGG